MKSGDKRDENPLTSTTPQPFVNGWGDNAIRFAETAEGSEGYILSINKDNATPAKKPQPHPTYQPISNLPEEGGHIEVVDLSGETADDPSPSIQGSPNATEHYNRWRQAIIDTQILQRKF